MTIHASGLTRRFGDFLAVENVDLDVPSGEVFGFLGPNGAGKTTTMRMLAGLVAPSSGTAEVGGISVTTSPEKVRAVVGILTESPGLYVRLDAVENLEFFARLHGVLRPAARIELLLKRFDLWDRRRDLTGTFSKGMRQKLAIARAVLHRPKVVFLDEPTSALDPEAAQVVRDLVRELQSDGAAVILCTHNLDEAERLCDRIAVIKQRVLCVEAPHLLDGAATERVIRVVIDGPALSALDVARAVPGVLRVEAEGKELRAWTLDARVATPAVVRALVTSGHDLVSVGEVRRRLEDVYLELVREKPL